MSNDATNYRLPWCEVVDGVTPRELPVIVGHSLKLSVPGFDGKEFVMYGKTSDIPDVWIKSGEDVYQVRFPRFTGRKALSAKIVGDDLIVVIE